MRPIPSYTKSLKGRIGQLQTKNFNLENSLSFLQRQLSFSQDECAKLERKNNQLNEYNYKFEKSFKMQQELNEKLKERLNRFENENEILNDEIRNLRKENSTFTERINETNIKISELNNKKNKLQEENTKLTNEYRELEQEKEKINVINDLQRKNIEDLEKAKKIVENDISKLKIIFQEISIIEYESKKDVEISAENVIQINEESGLKDLIEFAKKLKNQFKEQKKLQNYLINRNKRKNDIITKQRKDIEKLEKIPRFKIRLEEKTEAASNKKRKISQLKNGPDEENECCKQLRNKLEKLENVKNRIKIESNCFRTKVINLNWEIKKLKNEIKDLKK